MRTAGNAGGSAPDAMTCLTPSAIAAVEIAHLAGADIGGADRQPRRALIDQIEIDQLGQRPFQRRGGIVAGVVGAERIAVAGMSQRIGPEETGNAVGHRRPVRELSLKPGKMSRKLQIRILLHLLPELAQARQPVLRRIAGDQAGVDGADRGADDPVRLDAGLVQRLVDAGLIGAKRAAALQHQHDLPRPGPRRAISSSAKNRIVLNIFHVTLPGCSSL